MKQSISGLAKFADEISYKKFIKLSSKKQHELLASLAYESINKNCFESFLKRYNQLHEWGELDRFSPAPHLTEKEALKSYFDFHRSFAPVPLEPEKNIPKDIFWKPEFNLIIYMDGIRSPYNIGSILRIADNFGVKEIVHSSPHINLNHPRLKKSSRETHMWIPVRYQDDPVNWLKNSGYKVVGMEIHKNSVPLSQWEPDNKIIIVAGNEENGISKAILECCTELVHIPMFGFKKSMNVNNALSILCNKFAEVNQKTGHHPSY